MTIDIISWDSRTQKLVEEYGLSEFRYTHWMKSFGNDPKLVELQYIRHMGEILTMRWSDRPPLDSSNKSKSISDAIKARDVLLLYQELQDDKQNGTVEWIYLMQSNLEAFISALT